MFINCFVNQLIREHLVLVMVNDDASSRIGQNVVPKRNVLEPIVKHNRGVADGSHVAIRVLVILDYSVRTSWNFGRQRFVKNFNSNNSVLVFRLSIFVGNLLDDAASVSDSVSVTPTNGPIMPAVIVAILRSRRAVQVNPEFETSCPCPSDGVIDIWCCTLNVGVVELLKSPIWKI